MPFLSHFLENGVLQRIPLDNQQPDRLNCVPYDKAHKISIFMQSKFTGDDSEKRYQAGFSYVLEKIEENDEKGKKVV